MLKYGTRGDYEELLLASENSNLEYMDFSLYMDLSGEYINCHIAKFNNELYHRYICFDNSIHKYEFEDIYYKYRKTVNPYLYIDLGDMKRIGFYMFRYIYILDMTDEYITIRSSSYLYKIEDNSSDIFKQIVEMVNLKLIEC